MGMAVFGCMVLLLEVSCRNSSAKVLIKHEPALTRRRRGVAASSSELSSISTARQPTLAGDLSAVAPIHQLSPHFLRGCHVSFLQTVGATSTRGNCCSCEGSITLSRNHSAAQESFRQADSLQPLAMSNPAQRPKLRNLAEVAIANHGSLIVEITQGGASMIHSHLG